MRKLVVMMAALALAACATGPHSKPQVRMDNTAMVAARAPAMTDEELEDYIGERAEERLIELCGEQRTISSQMACVRDAAFRGFDTTGEAKRNCDTDAPLDPLLHCVIIGSMGYELAMSAKSAASHDWADPEGAMEQAVEALATQTVSDCMAVALSKVDGCVVQGVGRSFALSEQVITACTDETDSEKSLDCLIRAYVIQQFESAFQRMGPGPGQQA